jgi:cell wall-associated NlpC family hydrolase
LRPRMVASIALILALSLAPASSPDVAPAHPNVRSNTADGLPAAVDTQIALIARLARKTPGRRTPDPRLFDALARLEEMLPRSSATRRAQENGRRAYLSLIATKSARAGRKWIEVRSAVERQMRNDNQYRCALEAVDRRLALERSDAAPVKPASATGAPRSLPFDKMRPGDVMIWDDRSGPPLVRVALSLFAWKCTHSAIYLGSTTTPHGGIQRWTLEAQSPALGVRSAVMGRKWTRPGLHVALGHVNGFTPARAAQIAATAVETYGTDGRTPYHVWPPWDKTYTRDGMYCSQLVWSVYQRNGVDLDSNDWRYLAWFTVHNWFNPYAAPTAYFAVFPDEIKRSSHVTWYYDQVNP